VYTKHKLKHEQNTNQIQQFLQTQLKEEEKNRKKDEKIIQIKKFFKIELI